jgi:hypothetical protein
LASRGGLAARLPPVAKRSRSATVNRAQVSNVSNLPHIDKSAADAISLHRAARIVYVMQVLQAGSHKFLLLELDREFIENVARQAGFEFRFTEESRRVMLELNAEGRQAPLLLFDAADPANLGWFSRCQFYVDGVSGAVLQTPIQLANQRDRSGRALPNSVRIQINKELPASFRLPGKAPVTEQTVYSVLYNFLNALLNTGVGVCGGPVVQPLAGRTETLGNRN